MDDNELMTAVRERFGPVRMHTPAEAITARARSLRRRRSATLAGGGLAVALGAGLAVPAVTATGAAPARGTLAAWTVAYHRDGSIAVTIRELRDLPALQRAISASGARVTVKTLNAVPNGPANACLVRKWPAYSAIRFGDAIEGFGKAPRQDYFLLYPAKILPGTVLQITVSPGIKQPPGAPRPVPGTPLTASARKQLRGAPGPVTGMPSGAGVREVKPRSVPAASALTLPNFGDNPTVTFTPVRDVPSCVS